jgi:hypothetical protein
VSQGPVHASPVDAALRRLHLGVLATVAACALVVLAAAPGEGAPAPTSAFPIAAVSLALASVFARQAAAAVRSRTRVYLSLASLLLAASVALVGVVLALRGGPRGTALAYVLGAAILCLRPPLRSERR